MSPEIQLSRIREFRNRILQCTDKYASLPDYPFKDNQRQQLLNFRQQLRDLPESIVEVDENKYMIEYFPPKLDFIPELNLFY